MCTCMWHAMEFIHQFSNVGWRCCTFGTSGFCSNTNVKLTILSCMGKLSTTVLCERLNLFSANSFLLDQLYWGQNNLGPNWIRIVLPQILFAHRVVLLLLMFILCRFPPTFYSKCKYIVNVVFFSYLITFVFQYIFINWKAIYPVSWCDFTFRF